MKEEAEVMLPPAKELQEPPEAGRGTERFSPHCRREHIPANSFISHFWLLGLGEHFFLLCFSKICSDMLQPLQETTVVLLEL